jgi:hypothetical protein
MLKFFVQKYIVSPAGKANTIWVARYLLYGLIEKSNQLFLFCDSDKSSRNVIAKIVVNAI